MIGPNFYEILLDPTTYINIDRQTYNYFRIWDRKTALVPGTCVQAWVLPDKCLIDEDLPFFNIGLFGLLVTHSSSLNIG